MNLKHTRDVIEDWRRDYNEIRTHSSLKGSTPEEYTKAADRTLARGATNCGVMSQGIESLRVSRYARMHWRLDIESDSLKALGGINGLNA